MGHVYVAEDKTLGRRVALKVLRPEVADSKDRRERFHREAKAVAALNHPNIVTLYSVEEADGLLFLTMELVHGRSLSDLLRAGPMPLARTIALACQVGDGLASAHDAGVLHRDLKPDNLIVTEEDRVKILDFGLAKLVTPAVGMDTEGATMAREPSSPGMTLGTAGYMAPEQALGKKLDARADLFALGVVIYQMTTGRAPFEGETLAAFFDHLLNRPPVSPGKLNPSLPASMVAVIEKALEKNPERRYATARELTLDLKSIDPSSAGAPSHPRQGSIVVLPFVDLSPEKDQEYFCHGVAEELIHSLTRVSGLRVISRTSAFAFEGKGVEITEIGRRLKAATALEGSVRKSGRRIRVSARLVNTEDGYPLWSKRFDRELEDVFAIEDEIAETIVTELASELGGLSGQALDRSAPQNTEAHEAYLRGKYALNKWTEEWMGRAILWFQESIAHDPLFAPAYAALAECHVWLYSGVGVVPAKDAVPQAKEAVGKALELNPRLSDAHRVRGMIAMNHDWDRKGAEEALTRAVSLGPSSAEAHFWNAWRLALLEARYAEALVELNEAERLGPLDLQVKTQIGYVYCFLHDLDRAIEQFEKALDLEPRFGFAHYALGDAYAQKAEYERAVSELEKSIELDGRSVNHVGVLGYVHGRAGNADKATALLQELMERAATSYVSSMWPAMTHLGLGDRESVFHSLERAFAERDGSLVLITSAIEFDPVREDPRFKSLLERMGLPHLV